MNPPPPPSYYDTTYETALADGCDLVQLKYDGIYGRLTLGPAGADVYSKTDKSKGYLPISFAGGGDIRGEYMYGSQWAQAEARLGRFYAFDLASVGGEDLSSFNYSTRQSILRALLTEIGETPSLELIRSYPITEFPQLWKSHVSEGDFEGVVFRKSFANWAEPLGRQKATVTVDLVCTGFYEGEGKHSGRLGGIVCSRPTDNGLEEVTRVGGGFSDADRESIWENQEAFQGKVVEISGKRIFTSGAVRHPNFERWHLEKTLSDIQRA